MEHYETEEQQVDAIKKWWNENGTSLLIGLVLGVAALTGWKYYIGYQQQHSTEASDLYESMVSSLEANSYDEAAKNTFNTLKSNYADTPYVALASLYIAKYEYEQGEMDDALNNLKWAATNSGEEEIKHIAILRLTRLLIDQKNYTEAETWLQTKHPAAFEASYQELRGDLFVALGELEQARVAYDKALENEINPNRWLRLKREDLGSSTIKQTESIDPAS